MGHVQIDPFPQTNRLRCCVLEPGAGANFNLHVSLSTHVVRQLLDTLDITPHFVGALLGEPDYGAPGDFATYGEDGSIQRFGKNERLNHLLYMTVLKRP